jgi:hypothetical protein
MLAGTRFGAPTVIGIAGSYRDNGEPASLVAFEWPDSYQPREQAALEALHFERLMADLRAGGIPAMYETVTPGPNPPDFLCTFEGRQIGVEMTQLVLQERVEAAEYFEKVKQGFVSKGPGAFAHLAGRVVYVALDPQARRVPSVGDLVDRVAALQPVDPPHGPELPEQLDVEAHVAEHPPVHLTSALVTPTGTLFFNVMGFEVALAYSTAVEQGRAWALREHAAG